MTLLVLLASAGLAGNSLAVTAQQSAHTASAVVTERIVASASATQSPATASATLTERMALHITAAQASATAAASVVERASLAVTVQQTAPRANAALTERYLLAASAVQSAATVVVAFDEALSFATSAAQSPPTLTASMAERIAASVSAIQAPARALVSAQEAFAVGIAAQQAPNATANPSAPVEVTVAAQQDPATAGATMSTEPASVGIPIDELPMEPLSRRPGPRTRTYGVPPETYIPDPPVVRTLVVARQSGPTMRARLSHTAPVVLVARARQRRARCRAACEVAEPFTVAAWQAAHTARASVDADPFADDELALFSLLTV